LLNPSSAESLPQLLLIIKEYEETKENHFSEIEITCTGGLHQSLSVFRYSGRALGLVWTTSHTLTVVLAILTLVAVVTTGAVAYVGKLIVDSVVLASR
jgi:hypothetical protein